MDVEREWLDLVASVLAAPLTTLPEKRVALLQRTLQHGLEQVIELFPVIQVHRRFHR